MGRGEEREGVEREREREIYTVFPQHLNWIGCNNALTIQYQNGKYSLSLTPTHSSTERREEEEEGGEREIQEEEEEEEGLMYRLQYDKERDETHARETKEELTSGECADAGRK